MNLTIYTIWVPLLAASGVYLIALGVMLPLTKGEFYETAGLCLASFGALTFLSVSWLARKIESSKKR